MLGRHVFFLALASCCAGSAGAQSATDRQRIHEQRHEWVRPRPRDPSTQSMGSGIPMVGALPRELLSVEAFVCKADAIVVGVIGSAEAQVASAGDFVFTDYELNLEQTLKGSASGSVIVTRVGGDAQVNGKPKSFRYYLLPLLEPGKRYLLFLSGLQESESYAADLPGGAFLLTEAGEAEQVDGTSFAPELPAAWSKTGARAMLARLQAAIAKGCPQ